MTGIFDWRGIVVTPKKRKGNSTGAAPKRSSAFYMIVLVIVLAAVALVVLSKWGNGEGGSELDRLTAFKKNGSLAFVNAAGDTLQTIDIEIAESEEERSVGLMYRKPLEDTQGMLFVFPQQDQLSFWMHNTPVSLDMIFADSTGRIVTIHPKTKPFAQTSYQSSATAMYVVEVDAGFTDRFGVHVGDKVVWQKSE